MLEHPLLSPAKHSPRRVALACIQCRSRKVRCDANLPTCNRCVADGKICEYKKSRRGGRPRRPSIAHSQTTVENSSTRRTTQWTTSSENATDNTSSGHVSVESSNHSVCDSLDHGNQVGPLLSNNAGLMRTQSDHLLAQYYVYFHASHPCVLPRWSLQARMMSEPVIAEYLLPILLYIGSIFTHSIDKAPLAEAAFQAIQSGRKSTQYPNAYHIQALLLYSVAVYWSNEPEKGRKLLDEAVEAAFSIGMHHRAFAVQNGSGDAVLEESWRRTWWQLHVIDVNISGSTHTYKGLSTKFTATVELPCEEWEYESGSIPPSPTLQAYNNREFSTTEFSSFAHFIGFTQGIIRILLTRRVNDPENARKICLLADTMMTAWCALLPESKRRILRADGTVDLIMFKANILMHTYIVDLHRALSTLHYTPIESTSKCAPPAPPTSPSRSLNSSAPTHTAKILHAIDKLSTLLTLPTRLATHTPFLICMLANMTIAHLSACRWVFSVEEPKLALEREKIRLNMGVLKMLGEYWPAGGREYGSLGVIAREMLGLREEEIVVPTEVGAVDLDFGFDGGWDLASYAEMGLDGYGEGGALLDTDFVGLEGVSSCEVPYSSATVAT